MHDSLASRLQEAKERLSRAAQACLENRAGAAQEADEAQAEIESIRALMRAQAGQVCSEPGCMTITLHDKCDLHRPPDIWGESRRTIDELQAQEVSQQEDGER